MAVDAPAPRTWRWAFNTATWDPDEATWSRLLALLPPEDVTAVTRFVFKRDQKRAMAGRLLARHFLADAVGVPFKDAAFKRTPTHNKPYIACALPAPFAAATYNVSHHGAWVVLVADLDRLIGVDVMQFEPPRAGTSVDDFLTPFKAYLSEAEWSAVQSSANPLQAFTWHWACKEAVSKAFGDGLVMEGGFGTLSFAGLTDAVAGVAATGSSCAVTALRGGDPVPDCDMELSMLDDDHPVVVSRLPLSVAVEPLGDPWPPTVAPPPPTPRAERVATPFTVLAFDTLLRHAPR